MADRVSASIVLGGTINTTAFAELAGLIEQEGLSTEWDGEPFQPDDVIPDQPLSLYAHEVAWGRFEALESWCAANAVPFTRWSGAHGGQWGAERVVFTGTGEPKSFATDEDDHVLIGRETAEQLGSIEATRAYSTRRTLPCRRSLSWPSRPERCGYFPGVAAWRSLPPFRGRGLRLAS